MGLFGKADTKGMGVLDIAFMGFSCRLRYKPNGNKTMGLPHGITRLEFFFDWLRGLETELPGFLPFPLNISTVSGKAICFLSQQHHLIIFPFKSPEPDCLKIVFSLFLF